MRRLKATKKSEKCKYKRCTYKRVDNSRYCAKHVDNNIILTSVKTEQPGVISEHISLRPFYVLNDTKSTLLERIKSFIFVDK